MSWKHVFMQKSPKWQIDCSQKLWNYNDGRIFTYLMALEWNMCHKLVLSSLFLPNLCWDRQIQIVAVLSLDLCHCLWQRCSSQVSHSRTVGYMTIQQSLLMFLDDKLCHFDNLMKTCLPAHQRFVGIRGLTCTVILLIFVSGCHDHKKNVFIDSSAAC